MSDFEIFLSGTPGLEAVLCAGARECGFAKAKAVPGGVTIEGGWPEVWRANLEIRGASHVLARVAEFRAMHLAQLDKRARKVAWGEVLRAGIPFGVEATCAKSRIYHSGAAAQRIERAIKETLGAPADRAAEVRVMARIDDDLCTLSIDTSGEPLHKRDHKEAVGKAPMRETLASLFLRQCGYDGREPVVDPMCGSGTFVIEAAEIAAGLKPGRTRRFAFEQLATFDADAWAAMRGGGGESSNSPSPLIPAFSPLGRRGDGVESAPTEFPLSTGERDRVRGLGESKFQPPVISPAARFYGNDHDAGAIRMARANAARAGVAGFTVFRQLSVSELTAPDGPPGLVIVNPPYGERIGDKAELQSVYRVLGQVLLTRFAGWRVGLVTSEQDLARATGLPFGKPGAPVPHGGLRVVLWRTGALG
jgi:putative N6-adenine-specific DNA methylase